ncbi:MAG: glutamine-hydrolyzing GMP synthase, partial [Spirochaetales bacterium]|nr:glutamine-hydrolyzing GMP synthase [Spirochaetales bacterium]
MQEKILILDFGSQYTQLIARRVRELNVYCEIHPFNNYPQPDDSVKGVILSGSPFSVRDKGAPYPDLDSIKGKIPLLGVCYGAQHLAHNYGGRVHASDTREYGRAKMIYLNNNDPLFAGVDQGTQVWMSHGDTIEEIPPGYSVTGSTADVRVGAYHIQGESTWGIQFHPEVYHTVQGKKILSNFVLDICGCIRTWTADSFVESTVEKLKDTLKDDRVVLGLSGGVDSSVAAYLLNKAIGKNLTCIFVDNGLLRKGEFQKVLDSYKGLGLNVKGVNASDEFLDQLEGVSDPEEKRKIIGRVFIEIFDREALKVKDVKWLAQGTIY